MQHRDDVKRSLESMEKGRGEDITDGLPGGGTSI